MTAPVYGKDYLDNPPIRAVTAEEVRALRQKCKCGPTDKMAGDCTCNEDAMTYVLRRLLEHPGVSSTARAVIEAMLGVDRG
jgi:hypothetical protein